MVGTSFAFLKSGLDIVPSPSVMDGAVCKSGTAGTRIIGVRSCVRTLRPKNLQQIPSRGAFAKYIKRLLITDVGKLLIKVDFAAHELRGWSIISGDKQVAAVFEQGAVLRRRFRLVPDP